MYNVLARHLEMRYQRLVRMEAADLVEELERGSGGPGAGEVEGAGAWAGAEAEYQFDHIVEAAMTLSPVWHSGGAEVRGAWLPKLGRCAAPRHQPRRQSAGGGVLSGLSVIARSARARRHIEGYQMDGRMHIFDHHDVPPCVQSLGREPGSAPPRSFPRCFGQPPRC